MISGRIFVAIIAMGLVVGCTVKYGKESQGAIDDITASSAPIQLPNILLIVADDLGYADLGIYGGEIHTPNINALAKSGLTLTRFYASMTCSPTRAMLLTGTDNHLAGLGNMAETLASNQVGLPGYEGFLNQRVLTLAERLKDEGYHTYMAGKWHLGREPDQSPHARGFERSFALLNGGGSHFDDKVGPVYEDPHAIYREDGELVEKLPEGFYSTHFYTSRILDNIHAQLADGKPFFSYLAYTAPHWPLQAPDEIVDKYRGKFDKGYDVIRLRRFQRMKQMGLIPSAAELPERPEFIPAWDQLTANEKRRHARNMEIYAAMVDDLDTNVGRVIEYIKNKGIYDNTLVLVISDNGAAGLQLDRIPKFANHLNQFDNSLENLGRRNSFAFYGPEWAHVSEAPFRLYKGNNTEGGIRVPAIISYPSIGIGGVRNDSLLSVMDLLPTALEAAGVSYPNDRYRNRNLYPLKGRSLLPILRGHTDRVRDEEDFLGFELWGNRGLVKGDWKLLSFPAHQGGGDWQLYNLSKDVGEQRNLAESRPDKLSEMIEAWETYARENNVVLPDAGPFKMGVSQVDQALH